jgi:hypothetical protein
LCWSYWVHFCFIGCWSYFALPSPTLGVIWFEKMFMTGRYLYLLPYKSILWSWVRSIIDLLRVRIGCECVTWLWKSVHKWETFFILQLGFVGPTQILRASRLCQLQLLFF